jgi:hypothetical protein
MELCIKIFKKEIGLALGKEFATAKAHTSQFGTSITPVPDRSELVLSGSYFGVMDHLRALLSLYKSVHPHTWTSIVSLSHAIATNPAMLRQTECLVLLDVPLPVIRCIITNPSPSSLERAGKGRNIAYVSRTSGAQIVQGSRLGLGPNFNTTLSIVGNPVSIVTCLAMLCAQVPPLLDALPTWASHKDVVRMIVVAARRHVHQQVPASNPTLHVVPRADAPPPLLGTAPHEVLAHAFSSMVVGPHAPVHSQMPMHSTPKASPPKGNPAFAVAHAAVVAAPKGVGATQVPAPAHHKATTAAAKVSPPRPTRAGATPGPTPAGVATAAPQPAPQPATPRPATSPQPTIAKVLFDYAGNGVTVTEGETVSLSGRQQDGWTLATTTRGPAWLPSSYLSCN